MKTCTCIDSCKRRLAAFGRRLNDDSGSILLEYLVTTAVAVAFISGLIVYLSTDGGGLEQLAETFKQLYTELIARFAAVDAMRGGSLP